MTPEALDSLSRQDLIALVVSQVEQINVLQARVSELEALFDVPPKTPDNSSLPPSQRCKDQTSKDPTGPFQREALLDYLEEKAKKEQVRLSEKRRIEEEAQIAKERKLEAEKTAEEEAKLRAERERAGLFCQERLIQAYKALRVWS